MTTHLDDDLAQRHADGALEGAARDACAAHVAACEGCRLFVESYRALADALAGLAAPAPGPGFTRGVLARIEARERQAARERRAALAVVGAALFALAGLFGAAGASAWAPALSGWSSALGAALQGASVALDVAGPLVRALRLQLLLACVATALPLLLGLRRLAATESASVPG